MELLHWWIIGIIGIGYGGHFYITFSDWICEIRATKTPQPEPDIIKFPEPKRKAA